MATGIGTETRPPSATEAERVEPGRRRLRVAVAEGPAELVAPVRVRADRDRPAAELAEARNDVGRGIRLGDRVPQAAGIDLEGRPAVHERPQDRLVQLGRGSQVGRRHVRMEVALHDVEWPIVSNSPERAAASTSSNAGATISASDRPVTQLRTFDAWYGERTRSWTDPIVKS